jgi:hypothetical protein
LISRVICATTVGDSLWVATIDHKSFFPNLCERMNHLSPIYEYSGILTLGLEIVNLPANSFLEISVGFQRATSLVNQEKLKDHFSFLIRMILLN